MDHTSFFNLSCKYYPCHGMSEGQNCMFCYCPLYFLPIECGGNYKLLNNGLKDCSSCTKPHEVNGWKFVTDKLIEYHSILNNKSQTIEQKKETGYVEIGGKIFKKVPPPISEEEYYGS